MTAPNPKIKSAAKGVLFAVVYTVGYVFTAMFVTGGGHGNFLGMGLISPLWAINFLALVLLTQLEYLTARVVFVVSLLGYYAHIIYMVSAYWPDKKMVTHPGDLALPGLWFLAGQIVIWFVFFDQLIYLKYTADAEKLS